MSADTQRERKNRYERERRKAARALGLSEEQRAKNREHNRVYRERNREKIRARREPESEAFRNYMYRQRKGITWERERFAAWAAQNPEKLKAKEKRKRQTSTYKARRQIIERKKHIAGCKDRAALQARIIANIEAVVQRNLPEHVRSGVVAMLVERVYSGHLPIRITAEHGKAALADYRREVERFALQHASLDAPAGGDGFTLGKAIGVYS